MIRVFVVSALTLTVVARAFAAERFAVRDCMVVYEESFAKTQDEAWGRDAANDLAEILSKVTGSEVKAYSEGAWALEKVKVEGQERRIIFLCLQKEDSHPSSLVPHPFSPCEFRVKVTPERVFLLGRTETAVSYAMTEFVERFCGYRFLSQNGEDPYDVNPDLSVAPCDFTRKPAIEYRRIYRGYVNGWLDVKDMPKTARNFFRYQRQRRCRLRDADYAPDFRCRKIAKSDCHLVCQYLHPDKYFKDHPTWYAMDEKGNRCNILNAGCQLCYSNPEMRDAFAKVLLEMIEADKKADPVNYARVYDMGQGDCTSRLCCCPDCTKVVAKYNRKPGGNWEGGDAGLQLEFINDMARRVHAKHPEIKLRIFAYVSSEERPKNCPVEPGVIPWWCDVYSVSDHMVPLTHSMNRQRYDILKDWVANCEYVKVWDYMLYGSTPEVNVDAIAADAKIYRDLGICDIFMETEFQYQPFYDLHLYVLSELYFDPDQDVDKLVETWLRVYGKAAPKMREVVAHLRKLGPGELPANLGQWHGRRLPWYTVANFERLRTLCKEAYAMDASPSVRQRIAIAISGADEKLMELYRGLMGKDAELKAVTDEYVAMTKEWATYENTDSAKITATVKKIEERVLVDTLQFKDLPPELKDVPKADLKCQDWHARRVSASPSCDGVLLDDPDSEVGKAAVLRFRKPGRTITYPIPGGFYDSEQKKVLSRYELDIPPANRDGRYHWYNLGTVKLGKLTKCWFDGSWGLSAIFYHLYKLCDGAEGDVNTYEMWVSIKVGEKALHFDRCVMRRLHGERESK